MWTKANLNAKVNQNYYVTLKRSKELSEDNDAGWAATITK